MPSSWRGPRCDGFESAREVVQLARRWRAGHPICELPAGLDRGAPRLLEAGFVDIAVEFLDRLVHPVGERVALTLDVGVREVGALCLGEQHAKLGRGRG